MDYSPGADRASSTCARRNIPPSGRPIRSSGTPATVTPSSAITSRVRGSPTGACGRLHPCDRQAGAHRCRGHGLGPRGGPGPTGRVAGLQPERVKPRVRSQEGRGLLAEAGWRDTDGDGLGEDKDGKRFEFKPSGPTRATTSARRSPRFIPVSLDDVGVGAEMRVIEWAAFIKEFVEQRQVRGAGARARRRDGSGPVHRSGTPRRSAPTEFNGHLRQPRGRCAAETGPGAPAIGKSGSSTTTSIQEILAEDLPMVFLYCPGPPLGGVLAASSGIEPAPAGIGSRRPSGTCQSPAALMRSDHGAWLEWRSSSSIC